MSSAIWAGQRGFRAAKAMTLSMPISAKRLLSFGHGSVVVLYQHHSDTLDGGTGTDQLSASHGDRLSGGAGTDSFTPYLNEGDASPAAAITDFDPATEQVTVLFGAIDANRNTGDSDLTDNITLPPPREIPGFWGAAPFS